MHQILFINNLKQNKNDLVPYLSKRNSNVCLFSCMQQVRFLSNRTNTARPVSSFQFHSFCDWLANRKFYFFSAVTNYWSRWVGRYSSYYWTANYCCWGFAKPRTAFSYSLCNRSSKWTITRKKGGEWGNIPKAKKSGDRFRVCNLPGKWRGFGSKIKLFS